MQKRIIKDLVKTLSSVTKASKAKIITATDADKFIKKGSKKNPRPEHLNDLSKLSIQVVHIGYNYNQLVKRSLAKAGVKDVTEVWEETPCRYSKVFSKNGLIREAIKEDSDTMYLRYYLAANNYKEDVYVNSMNEIVEVSESDKADWFKKVSASKKQTEAGIKNEIKIRNIKLENLYYFQNGAIVYNRLSKELMETLELEYID